MTARFVGALLDRSVVRSFDRSGFERHARGFHRANLEVDLSGRSAAITGANSGIGFETALRLSQLGADVFMLCRSLERGNRAADAIGSELGRRPKLVVVDVSDFDSVRSAVGELPETLDILVHNAGVLPRERMLAPSGLELTLATNLVGPFLLTWLLRHKLANSSTARVIHVSSGGMYSKRLVVDELNDLHGVFDGVQAYARTKRAQVVLSELLADRLGPAVQVHAMHPGWADTAGVQTSIPRFHRLTRSILRTPAQGADTVVWLAAAGLAGEPTGGFWFDRRRVRTHLVPWTRESSSERSHLWKQLCRWVQPGEPSRNGYRGDR